MTPTLSFPFPCRYASAVAVARNDTAGGNGTATSIGLIAGLPMKQDAAPFSPPAWVPVDAPSPPSPSPSPTPTPAPPSANATAPSENGTVAEAPGASPAEEEEAEEEEEEATFGGGLDAPLDNATAVLTAAYVDGMAKRNATRAAVTLTLHPSDRPTGIPAIVLNATAFDWTKPPCAITNHTYYPAVLAFRGIADTGGLEVSCGDGYYRK